MTVDLKITELGAAGDGIAHSNGKTYYVPYTLPGDIITAEEGEKKGKGFTAELSSIVTPSDLRTKPPCKHFGTCGGCSLQHMQDDALAEWKIQLIRENLSRAGIEDVTFNPVQTSPAHSRRRVEFVAAKRKKGVMIGYHLKRSHQINDIGECPLINKELMALVQPLRLLLSDIMPRNSRARLILTNSPNGPDLLISAEFSVDLDIREKLASFAAEYGLSRICWLDQTDKYLETVCEFKPVEIPIGQSKVAISPGGFLQATQEGQETLINLTLSEIPSGAAIADLFAGCGSFTLPATAVAKHITAYENDLYLINALKKSANTNMLPITAEERDLFRNPVPAHELNNFDCVIIDPPRAGASAQVEEIGYSTLKKVIFISCSPASFSRDAQHLIEAGYQMGPVTPIDQFRWSNHVELFATFTRP